jgi:2-phospho-L-lactate/phosphoenolpyruvate guanylyltransferase
VPSPLADTVVLIPIRSFDDTKSRLAEVLDADERRLLSMWMAARVIRAAGDLPSRVVTDDENVAQWARRQGTGVLTVDVQGLNPAVTAAASRAADLGFERVIIAHADLPAAVDLSVVDTPGVGIAPDRERDGSNVICVPTRAGFEFAYGPGSFARHCAEARRLNLELTVVEDDTLAWDVDDPADLPDDWRTIARTPEHH